MATPTDYAVTSAMIAHGGSFVAALGALFQRADAENAERLKAAFPEYWARYTALAGHIDKNGVPHDRP